MLEKAEKLPQPMTGNRTFVFVNRKKAVVGQMLYLEQ